MTQPQFFQTCTERVGSASPKLRHSNGTKAMLHREHSAMFALSADGDAPRGQRWSAAPFTKSRDDPSPFVDVELHQASHFQQEGLASFLIDDIGALHDLVNFQRLLAKRAQDIFSIIQHNQTPISSTLDQ